jgi:hypothetical protein
MSIRCVKEVTTDAGVLSRPLDPKTSHGKYLDLSGRGGERGYELEEDRISGCPVRVHIRSCISLSSD